MSTDGPDRNGTNSIRRTAFHEAGHAVAAYVFEIPFYKVDINIRRLESGDWSLGFTHLGANPSGITPNLRGNRNLCQRLVVYSLAGQIAEALAEDNLSWSVDQSDDLAQAKRYIRLCECEYSINGDQATYLSASLEATEIPRQEILKRGVQQAADFVRMARRSIADVAEALLKQKALSVEQVGAICAPMLASLKADARQLGL